MIVLVDTSVWIDHLRKPSRLLTGMIEAREVRMHRMVLGELLCGAVRDRASLRASWRALPKCRLCSHEEIYDLIEIHGLSGTGIGFVDAHLVGSTLRTPGAKLWTRDRSLDRVALRLGVVFHDGSTDDRVSNAS